MKLPIQKQIFDSNHIELKDADGIYIAIVDKESDADEIVKAVNNFYPMLEALKWCLTVIEEEVADGEHTSGYIIGSGAVKQAEDE